jgi:outer membrane protein assembly factor BamC
MGFKIARRVVFVFIAVAVSACGSLPDKEKEYQLSSTLPVLVLPDDLIEKSAVHTDAQIEGQSVDNSFVDENSTKVELYENSEGKDGKENVLLDLGNHSDGTALIKMGDSIARSWRIVGKALSHQSIEITDRDELAKIYFVQYDSEFEKVEDGSLWDEILFIFGSDPANEQQFGVKLIDNGKDTEIIILDSENKTVSKGAGLKLLHLLHDTIKEDLDKNSFYSE